MSGLGQEDNWVEKEWTPAERFAANVVWFRLKAGLTQQELADRVGMNRVSLGELERGLGCLASTPSSGWSPVW
jgi:DNA-binding XRE family transcriptional regulator